MGSGPRTSLEPISRAIPGALASLLRAMPLSPGKVGFAWRAAVGPALERVTDVHFEDHTLFVDSLNAQWTRELRRSTPVIMRRLEALLGEGVVAKISVRSRHA